MARTEARHLTREHAMAISNAQLTKTIPTIKVPLTREFYQLVRDSDKTLSEVCSAAGVGTKTAQRWRFMSPLLTNFLAALNALGYDLVIVKKDRTQ